MNPYLALVAAYFVGAIPFGYLVARMKGVDLFQAGSGNIGATNVGRVLGRTYGILVFILDFLKGAVPVYLASLLPEATRKQLGPITLLPVLVALFAFLGHLYPIYLGFRGGKGVATGAGTVMVLTPGPAILAITIWFVTTISSLWVSLGSVFAVIALTTARFLSAPTPLSGTDAPATYFCIAGTLLVIFKHIPNLKRIFQGSENQWPNKPVWQTMRKAIHLLALGLCFGSAIFFNFIAAPAMNQSFQQAITTAPNDRTAYLDITKDLTPEQTKSLASALFGTAVGPLFPRFFAIQGIGLVLAFLTACGWWSESGRVHRIRVFLLAFAIFLVAVSWPISQYVTELRLARFAQDMEVAVDAKSQFAVWHLISLLLSALTALATIVLMIMAAWLPQTRSNVESTVLNGK